MRRACEAHAEAPFPDSLKDFEEGLHLVREGLRTRSPILSSRWEGFLQRVDLLETLVPYLDSALRTGLTVQLALGIRGW
ncbi:hypothetical protein [Thermus neutrinimicus]|uniref:hypothetical protein n=1 Tax=Thermus neutrinimicus TaxID=2908149 RepID=UPI001FAA5C60|nr:hypothetical protein [Thermus neutrinimicus]